MGKNRVIKTLIKYVSNLILHKIIFKFGNRPDAKHFVESEIIAYRESAIEEAIEYNWNDVDKLKIIHQSTIIARNKLKNDYPDVSFREEDLEYFAEETLKEVLN